MLTEQQKKIALAIVNIFETGSAEGNYADITLIKGDKGHLTYGRSQTTLSSGNLYLLIRDYCATPDAPYAADLAPYLPRLKAKDLSLDNDSNLKSLLRQAGNEPLMRAVQDVFFDRVYWMPAVKNAQSAGFLLPLSFAVVYDSRVHGSWEDRSEKTTKAIGPVAEVGEKAWIESYVQRRHEWLATHTNKVLHNTIYRMKAFQSLIQAGNWELQPPLVVKGVTIRGETVEPALKVVILADNSLIDCHPQLENNRIRVDMRPVCEALKAALPTGTALAALNPVVVPPGVTRADLSPLAEGSGWELLTHKMADESKIYLRKKA